jgi:two-component system, NarL family, nitrate/nitrite response regulator NarL
MMGEKVYPTNLAAMLLDLTSTPSPRNSVRGLSPREQDILRALVTGASNKMIANNFRDHGSDGEGPPQDSAADPG